MDKIQEENKQDQRDHIIEENKKLIKELDSQLSNLKKTKLLLSLELDKERGKFIAMKQAFEYLAGRVTQ